MSREEQRSSLVEHGDDPAPAGVDPSPTPGSPRSGNIEPPDVQAARAVMEAHYREVVRPVSQVCEGILTWLDKITENHAPSDEPKGPPHDEVLERIAVLWAANGFSLSITARKSNLLYRLLYVGEKAREKPCPVHKGHWSGCPWPGDECKAGCTTHGNATGWI